MEYLLKASAVIALMYLCFHFFLKKETFFEHNRWFLFTGLLLALIFPLIVIPIYIPVEPLVTQTTTLIKSTPSSFVATPQPEVAFDWFKLIPILYGIGLSVFLIQFVFQFGSLVLLLLKNPKHKDQHFTYVVVENKISPFSFFKWIVYNPESYEAEELQLILTHEKVHVNQLHSIDILLTQLACVVFWFNPLIWLYRKAVRQNLEYIADFKSQKSSHTKKDYQHLLLKTSVANHDTILSNNFYNSSIKKRILMLNKSRSNRKNQWKYLLMLPLLAGLLISMNTEEVYIENNPTTIANDNTIELVVTKNTSDSELKTMTKAIENKGGTLVFSQIERNASNELINIFLKLNNHSYGGGNSQDPIDAFIIYKEFFGLGGGYVGRINGATLHYDNNEKFYDEKTTEELSYRAHKAILKAGIQTEEDFKKFEQQRANLKNEKDSKKKASITSESFKVKFTKNLTDESLEKMKTWLQTKNVTMTIKHLKRNSKNEISSINIDFKTQNSTANYSVKDNDGIKDFEFRMDENGSFGVGAVQDEDYLEEIYIIEETTNQHSQRLQNHVIDQDSLEIIVEDSIYFKTQTPKHHSYIKVINSNKNSNDTIYLAIDSLEVQSLSKVKSDMYYEGGKTLKINDSNEEFSIHQPATNYKVITNSDNQNPKPLVLVNGKVVSSDNLKSFSAENIESVTVLKDERAINKYGEKGKNGVIELTTKESVVITKKDNPLQITRSELTSITFIDDEDASKNASIAYISKYTPDKVLDNHKMNLENIGITVKYSKLKRNKAGEIISIKITLDDEKGRKTSATWKVDDGIPNIEYGQSEGKLITRTKQL